MSLLILSKYHKEWVSIVRTFGGGEISEDIVQEMYLKYNDNFIQNNQPNRAYIWITLRNIFLNEIKQKENINFVESEPIDEQLFESLMKRANKEMEQWHWYDKKLFEIYIYKDLSMRDIAKETNISLRSIFSTIKSCKERLNEKLKDDYIKLKL
jgi:DNA-directed RNA polymerase specialized sigma24 family protein